MTDLNFFNYHLKSPGKKIVTILECQGRIDTSTTGIFEDKLSGLLRNNEINLCVNLERVKYINSTGMGLIIKNVDEYKARNGFIVFMNPTEDVQNVIKSLGLKPLIKIIENEEQLFALADEQGGDSRPEEFIEKSESEELPEVEEEVKTVEERDIKVSRKTLSQKMLLVLPQRDLFAKLMAAKLQKKGIKLNVVNTAEDCLSALKKESFDLIMLDTFLDTANDLCNKLKRNKNTNLIPVIKLYSEGSNPKAIDGLTLRENELLCEPFDLDALSELALRELQKISKRRDTLEQDIRFQFRSREEDINLVNDLILDLMKQTGLDEKAAISLGAAFREGTDNANRHGNKAQEDRMVDVSYRVTDDKIIIKIIDEGEGFNWKNYIDIAKGLDAATRSRQRTAQGKRGGLGIMLMVKCTDYLEYNEKGNSLTLIKYKNKK